MTRDEAKQAAKALWPTLTNKSTGQKEQMPLTPASFVSICERLGMLKLDEPKAMPKVKMFEAVRICRTAYNDTDAFVDGLELQGYKIVEK